MKIIISPARSMQSDQDSLPWETLPQFLPETAQILSWMRTLTYDQLRRLWWNCSPQIASHSYRQVQTMNLKDQLTPAILAFTGLQYKYMAPGVFTDDELAYISARLRILSGFYGLLRPFDGIVPYRLGMGDRAKVAGTPNLYAFWGRRLYDELFSDGQAVINLASKEYERAVRPYLTPHDRFITCVFCTVVKGRVKQQTTRAKMARGNMVRYLAENNIKTVEKIKKFTVGGYCYRDDLSSKDRLVFQQVKK